MLDINNVKFATRSFIDEFYNLFLKNPSVHPYRVEITNVSEDINTILEAVSRTQTTAKVIPSQTPEVSFSSVEDCYTILKRVAF